VLPVRAQNLALTVEVRARALAPGEPLRIVAVSPQPLRSLSGVCLGEPVTMVRVGETNGSGGVEVWSGWGLIDLDRKPGPGAIELRGEAADGRDARGTRALTVKAKRFPEQHLEVESIYVEPPREARERIQRERARLDKIYAVRRGVPPPTVPFERPVPGENTSVFGARRVFNGTPSPPHSGLDLRAPTGTPVRAAGPGIVALADDLYYAGRTVILDHGGGLFTIYAHLSELRVEEGDRVETGRVIGLSGATGRVTGPHLHWGGKIGERIFDPSALLSASLFEEASATASGEP